MKTREANLFRVVAAMYEIVNINYKMIPEDLNAYQKGFLNEVYNSLGGKQDVPPLNFGRWDIVTKDFIIELDEEQHFNRYRKKTLDSSLYDNHPWFDIENYKKYCTEKESECKKKAQHGGYWANASTEKQFGKASEEGDLSGNGSPRWKQRAFYDFCRDLYSIVFEIPVYRFSIYDVFNMNNTNIELGKALENGNNPAIKFYVAKQIKTKV